MIITFLGTNGWYDTDTGNTCSVLVETKDYDIIFDAGNGIAKADRYISQEKPVFLFISHTHLDHIVGLHTLVKFRFLQGLVIAGQPGIEHDLRSVVRVPYTVPFEELPYRVQFVELEPGTHHLPFRIDCLPLVHPVPCYGYRLVIEGKVLAYCTDTGPNENAVRLAKDADLLITECGLKPGHESPDWPHLNPEMAIRIATKAGAEKLALMHFSAEKYRTIEERKEVEDTFRPLFPGLIATHDDLRISL